METQHNGSILQFLVIGATFPLPMLLAYNVVEINWLLNTFMFSSSKKEGSKRAGTFFSFSTFLPGQGSHRICDLDTQVLHIAWMRWMNEWTAPPSFTWGCNISLGIDLLKTLTYNKYSKIVKYTSTLIWSSMMGWCPLWTGCFNLELLHTTNKCCDKLYSIHNEDRKNNLLKWLNMWQYDELYLSIRIVSLRV